MDVEGGVDGPGFLDTIPEDVSVAVAASQHAVNLSTVSAVASSDSGEHEITNKKSEENVSDVNAEVGRPSLDRPKVDDTPKPFLLSTKCKKWSLIFLGIVSVLAIAIGIGMYVILDKTPQEYGDDVLNPENETSSTRDQNPLFPSFEVNYATDTPTSSPVYSPSEIQTLDNSFLKVSGTNFGNIYNTNTPEGKGRDWMINEDAAINVEDEQKVQQRYIMSVLYFATNGAFWKRKQNWLNPERSECDWYGITCDNIDNIVERIDLSNNGISGELPDEISSLSNLIAFNMSYGNITGTIPEKIFDLLDNIETIDIQENQISGTIPKRTTRISDSKLIYVNLESNQLTGDFPWFPNVESIIFKLNNLTSIDPRYWTSSPSLKFFKGFHNRLSGSLPKSYNLPDLIELDLGYNFWTGSIPQSLWNLPSLKTLWLDHCNLTGPLPSYSESKNMRRLWLDSNLLTGTIPSSFGYNWTKLYSVKLKNNSLSGSISPEQCSRWSRSNPDDVTSEKRAWTFDVDCQIGCSCCTNNDCVSQ